MSVKHTSLLLTALFVAFALNAQEVEMDFTEASGLTLVGKLFPDTPNPYHRLDTVVYTGLTPRENLLSRQSSGIAVAFRTDTKRLDIRTKYGYKGYGTNITGISSRGYDLYIKKDGKWLWAKAGVAPDKKIEEPFTLIGHLDGQMHECLLYLPTFSEVYSVQIGVEKGSRLEAMENPFRHRVAIFGSSFTHGASTSRSGMTYPAIFSRETGIQLLSLGVSGNCKLQPAFARALAAADVEAYIFDTFSNPSVEEIRDRLFPFIETLQAAHPGVPLIFQQTIYREGRNFSTDAERKESKRIEFVKGLMKEACSKYKDVYFITCTNATSPEHDTSVDGTHPDDHGYFLWARSVEKPILSILRKYGIK